MCTIEFNLPIYPTGCHDSLETKAIVYLYVTKGSFSWDLESDNEFKIYLANFLVTLLGGGDVTYVFFHQNYFK